MSIERRLRDRHILLPHDRVWEHVRTLMRAGLAARVPGRASAGRAAARALTGMPAQVTPEVAKHLEAAGVAVKPYDVVLADVRALATAGVRIWADYANRAPASAWLSAAVRRATAARSCLSARRAVWSARAHGKQAVLCARGACKARAWAPEAANGLCSSNSHAHMGFSRCSAGRR